MNIKGKICRNAALAGAAKTRDVTVNGYAVLHMECPSIRISGHKLNLTLFLLHSSWLRHCATSRKVEGSISDGVIGIFH